MSSSDPLSSTLPWTIRLSLAVLWGVCWMFHPTDISDGRVNYSSTDQQYSVDWDQIQQSYREDPNVDLATTHSVRMAQPGLMTELSFQHCQQVSDLASSTLSCAPSRGIIRSRPMTNMQVETATPRQPRSWSSQPSSLDQSNTYTCHEPQSRHCLSPETFWPLVGGNNTSDHAVLAALSKNPDVEATSSNSHTPQAAFRYRIDPRTIYTGHEPVPSTFPRSPSASSRIAPTSSETALSSYLTSQFSNLDMVEGIAYPISPPSDEESSRPTSNIDIRMKTEQEAQHHEITSNRSYPQTFKRDRTPPRNSKDEIFCDHADCADKREIFTRPCEWNKHMDKHERPYKCLERGCERLLGFTYSGGLLRHNREVHKKALATRTPLYCPFPNCNRNLSSGHGFTRQENLNEHKRRRHTGEESPTTPNLSIEPVDSPRHKRKRTLDSLDEQDSQNDEGTDDEITALTKRSRSMSDEQSRLLFNRLRADIQQRDERIAQQSAYIDSLRTTIRSLQQQKGMPRGPADGKWA